MSTVRHRPNGTALDPAPSAANQAALSQRMSAELVTWRREMRAALIARRQTLSTEERNHAATEIAAAVEALIQERAIQRIGLYWPIRHEPNLLPWARRLAHELDVILCLPVVVTPKAPLEYWRWTPGAAMAKGFWNIPVPAERSEVFPDLILAPLVGFDAANYRLGYGGGYFDRTLAARRPRPFAVGVGFEFGALDTIFPQPHDMPMDMIVTDRRRTPATGQSDATA
jgi:5,10-methenyltetrahydrofolate synthetase